MVRQVGESDIRVYLDKWDKKYWTTYKVLDILQKVFYRCGTARLQPGEGRGGGAVAVVLDIRVCGSQGGRV